MILPKVRLRAMEPEDLDDLYTIENDRSLWNVGITNVPYSRYALKDFLSHSAYDIYQDRQVRMMIENSNAVVVGILDLMNFDPQHNRAEVGIVVKEPFRNKGYAHAALEQCVEYARNVLHLHVLYAIVDAEHQVSLNLFSSLQFVKTGLLHDWLFDGKQYRAACMMQKTL